MTRGLAVAIWAASVGSAWALDVPSGQPIHLHEVIADTVGTEIWLRFRFIAPEIARDGGSVDFAMAEPDFEHLCHTVSLPYIAASDVSPDMAVITLLDRAIPFGTTDPETTQFVEVFRVSAGACVWEGV
ncbi:DUF6497 family protein [uncultured Roseobacter sp.]|uniref:DUF6497 family protein n=1 Tax=uncultured Roseobacter sp. TaxID=114847 RepID=UPI0026114C59|nr:DUF6497 family protein [uncultured Roseobacter sp.]